jgi:hypothetical protein
MCDTEDLYEILQVHPSAEPDVIQAAYRRLALRYHPDRNQSPEADEMMRRLNLAYAILRDPSHRADYDRIRAEDTGSGTRGAGPRTGSDKSGSHYGQEHYGNLRDSFVVRGLRSIFLGAIGSVWGFLLLVVSLIAAVTFVSFVWWISDLLSAIGWWPLAVLLRIATWLMIGALALRILFLVWMVATAIGRLVWRTSGLIVKPHVPTSVGVVFIVLIVVITVGATIVSQFKPESLDNQEIELSSDAGGLASEPQIQATSSPAPPDSLLRWTENDVRHSLSGSATFSGTVRNLDNQWSVEAARIYITIYDISKKVIKTFDAALLPAAIGPYETGTYSVTEHLPALAATYETEIIWDWSPP